MDSEKGMTEWYLEEEVGTDSGREEERKHGGGEEITKRQMRKTVGVR